MKVLCKKNHQYDDIIFIKNECRIYNKANYIDMDSNYEFEKYFTTLTEHRKLKLEKINTCE